MKKGREKKKKEKSDKTHVKISLWSFNDRKSTKTWKNFRGKRKISGWPEYKPLRNIFFLSLLIFIHQELHLLILHSGIKSTIHPSSASFIHPLRLESHHSWIQQRLVQPQFMAYPVSNFVPVPEPSADGVTDGKTLTWTSKFKTSSYCFQWTVI